MKLFAQHGASNGEKTTEGFARGLLDGVIYSPRDVSLASLKEKLATVKAAASSAERLVDPQYYAIFLKSAEEARLGYLLEEDYDAYFQPRRRSQLERESQIENELAAALIFQSGLNVTGIIAPNILIPNSLNSIEAVISKNFNHALAVNGFKVINGYSDILTPFLSVAGGAAGALGWWSNLKVFSLNRFAPSAGGGRSPIQRYLSLALLNRITFFEFNQLRKMFPAILNKLAGDDLYDPAIGSEPPRNMEVVHSWEAIKVLNALLAGTDQAKALEKCTNATKQAGLLYETIKARAVRLDQKSNDEHIQPLMDGLGLFKKLAEL